MSQTSFDLVYDGPALDDGTMAVRDLAPPLIALGELFSEAASVLYPDKPAVSLNIRATDEGSFVVALMLESTVLEQVIDIFSSDGGSALANLLQYVGGATGLFAFIKWVRGRRIKGRSLPKQGMVRITLEDGTVLEWPVATLELFDSLSIRRKTRVIIDPVRQDGVDAMRFEVDDEVTVEVGDEDTASFALPTMEAETLVEVDQRMFVEIASVAFKENNKWRLSDGSNTFWASLEDPAFIARVDAGVEKFSSGDQLDCMMRVTQLRDQDGLHTLREVREVFEHIPYRSPGKQLELGDGSDDVDGPAG